MRLLYDIADESPKQRKPSFFHRTINRLKQLLKPKTSLSSNPTAVSNDGITNDKSTTTTDFSANPSTNDSSGSLTPIEKLLLKLNAGRPSFHLDEKPNYDAKLTTENQQLFIKKLYESLEKNPNYKITEEDLNQLDDKELEQLEMITKATKYLFAREKLNQPDDKKLEQSITQATKKLNFIRKWQLKKMEKIKKELEKNPYGSPNHGIWWFRQLRLELFGF